MSADRVHANIDQIMRKHKNIYTFPEFVDVIKKSRKKLEVKTLTHKDVYLFQKMQKLDVNKILKLREVKMYCFRKECFDLNVKYNYSTEESFILNDIKKPEFKQLISKSFVSKTSNQI
jgi:hypothetical protein